MNLYEVRKESAHSLDAALKLLRVSSIDGNFRAALPECCPIVLLHVQSDLILGGSEAVRDIEPAKCDHTFD